MLHPTRERVVDNKFLVRVALYRMGERLTDHGIGILKPTSDFVGRRRPKLGAAPFAGLSGREFDDGHG